MRNRAAQIILLILVGVCLTAAQSAKKPVAEPSSETQSDKVAIEISAELRTAVQRDHVDDVTGNPMWKAAGLIYDVHMADCENRWVALYHKPEDKNYTYGFVYIDPEAGFTVQYGGRFTIETNGKYDLAPNPIPPDKMNLKIRLDRNGVAALLPPKALLELGLPGKPDWLKFYEDKSDPVVHNVNWGSFYNGIGDSRRAIDYLEAAYTERPDAPKVVFELVYAYNALDRSEDAIRLSKSGFAKDPKDELLCREMAFAYLNLKNYNEAATQYQVCISLCGESESALAEKSELAMNLSSTYKALADTRNSEAWRERAKLWAPKGSPIYRYFHPGED